VFLCLCKQLSCLSAKTPREALVFFWRTNTQNVKIIIVKPSLKYATLFVLIFFFCIRTLFLLVYDATYTYDEIVVTEISKQPTPLLFKTIVSEPHPPGFYLILKPFSELPDKTLKIIISFINFFISLLALLYFQNSKLFKKYYFSFLPQMQFPIPIKHSRSNALNPKK